MSTGRASRSRTALASREVPPSGCGRRRSGPAWSSSGTRQSTTHRAREPPELVEFGDPSWEGYTRQGYVLSTSAQEIVENAIDVAHGQFVHGNAQGAAPPKVAFSFDDHTVTAQFQNDIPSVSGATEHTATIHGLGLVVNRSVGQGAKCFWTTYTPIDADTVEVHFSMLAAVSTPDDPTGDKSRRSARGTLLEFEKDIPIWEHKIYRAVPLLCDGDGPIGRFRIWARQFYPQSGTGSTPATARTAPGDERTEAHNQQQRV